MQMLGPDGLVTGHSAHAVQRGRWLGESPATRASTIGAVTSETERKLTTKQVPGLPRDPAILPR